MGHLVRYESFTGSWLSNSQCGIFRVQIQNQIIACPDLGLHLKRRLPTTNPAAFPATNIHHRLVSAPSSVICLDTDRRVLELNLCPELLDGLLNTSPEDLICSPGQFSLLAGKLVL